ncbi:MAG: hypothetical protein MJE68_13195 [Proteobacteria bacterium]|nr:hypothetical protein [Pseudomonadota bacterium]
MQTDDDEPVPIAPLLWIATSSIVATVTGWMATNAADKHEAEKLQIAEDERQQKEKEKQQKLRAERKQRERAEKKRRQRNAMIIGFILTIIASVISGLILGILLG